MARNRIRDLSTQQLLVEVVTELIHSKMDPFPTDPTSRRAERLYRELTRRSDAGIAHTDECVCEECSRYFDEIHDFAGLLDDRDGRIAP